MKLLIAALVLIALLIFAAVASIAHSVATIQRYVSGKRRLKDL